eukprot:CAMPEP_0197260906 /NCGR_PEP_ID=MMETSP1429-20130617/84272_1 /TAXON_ID=49237 /ORGANISM="Chaetoceros  sp., Strain UNC1202" /LENGTH=275 /DNA_ID=CAMNT_0042725155 /DNA_START=557 /DNA_END=1381 /DNA_ORIENTATION=+
MSYSPASDLLAASLVNRRWLLASRDDELWKFACICLWEDKVGMPLVRKGNSIALFWRTFLQPRVVNERMTVKEIRSLFAERPLGRRAVMDAFSACLEKCDMQTTVLELMPTHLGGVAPAAPSAPCCCGLGNNDYSSDGEEENDGMVLTLGFDDLWFGSYASSIVDSRRSRITVDELLSRKGFLMHFKIFQENGNDTRYGMTGEQSGGEEDDEGMHGLGLGTCYFEEDENKFRVEESDDAEMLHPQGLHWKWCGTDKKFVQVGHYPPLKIHRLENW